MSQDFYQELDCRLTDLVCETFASARAETAGQSSGEARFHFSPPRDPAHGDLASSAAMMLAKGERTSPMQLAETLAEKLRGWQELRSVEVAAPGFINVRLQTFALAGELLRILADPQKFSHSDVGQQKRVNVEYVSVNPTGPLHVGHARGAVFGDALSALLQRIGYRVSREYYVNDAGAQVDVLAHSVYRRYLQALGDTGQTFEAPLYPGEYLIPLGQELAKEFGTKYQCASEQEWLQPIRERAVAAMMELIKADLAALGVVQDVYTSERSLVEAGAVEETLDFLREKGLVYQGVLPKPKGKPSEDWEPREQLLFRASDFGDETDRALLKSDGSWTYFTPDISYHHDKIRREFQWLINIFGADHIGYVKRLKAAVAALSGVPIDILCCQIVRFMENAQPVRMSKRQGTFIGIQTLIDAVGKDVTRLHLLLRKNDAHMDFDLEELRRQSLDNPVFYIQYAHARCFSALRHAEESFADLPLLDENSLATELAGEADHRLLCALAEYPAQLRRAGVALEVHRVALYLRSLAKELHGFWNLGKDDAGLRVVVAGNATRTAARVMLLRGVKQVLADGLELLGVSAVDELR